MIRRNNSHLFSVGFNMFQTSAGAGFFGSHGMMGSKPSGWFFVAVERPDEWCGWKLKQLGI